MTIRELLARMLVAAPPAVLIAQFAYHQSIAWSFIDGLLVGFAMLPQGGRL